MNAQFKIVGLLLLSIVLTFGTVSAQDFSIEAEIGLLYDFDSQQILFSQNGDQEWIPASLVKIMTMYIAMDRISEGDIALTDTIVVSEKSWQMGGSQMFLEVGDEVIVEDLLYGIAVVSGNDACVSIAEALAGSEQLFVKWMNDKAAELGLQGTTFTDVHGLSENNRITASDAAVLVNNYLHDHIDVLKYHSARSFGYQPRSSKQPIIQPNRNGLLLSYDGADGLKTGFLSKAGYNLIATAQQNDRRLVAIVLGAQSESKREAEAIKLLNYGFRSFETISTKGLVGEENQVRVYKGQQKNVGISPALENITVPRGSRNNITSRIQYESSLQAPLAAGDQVGELIILEGEKTIKRVPLLATESIERGNLFRVIVDAIIMFFSQLITFEK